MYLSKLHYVIIYRKLEQLLSNFLGNGVHRVHKLKIFSILNRLL
jgi:hypothetical protein